MPELVDSMAKNSSSKLVFVLVLIAAFAIRITALIVLPDGLNQDTDDYRDIAETLRGSGVFGFGFHADAKTRPVGVAIGHEPTRTPVRPTAFRPPLYPLLLSIFVTDGRLTPVAVAIVHLGCGLLTVTIVWVLGTQWKLGRWVPVAAIFTACDPILLHQSTHLMTETLAALAAALALLGLTRFLFQQSTMNALLAGCLLGMACLCRPTFLPWSGLVVLSCYYCFQGTFGQRSQHAATVLAGICLTLLPWGLRNYRQFGDLKLTTTNGGYTLLLANNPSYYTFLREGGWGQVWDSQELDAAWSQRARLRDANDDLFGSTRTPAFSVLRNEFEDDRLAYGFAQRFIRQDPSTFLYSCFYRLGSLWHVLPHQLSENESTGRWLMRCATAVWYLGIFGCAVCGMWKLKGELLRLPWLWGILLCLTFSAVHSIYWSNMRMRAPVIPFVALLAAAGLRRATRERAGSD